MSTIPLDIRRLTYADLPQVIAIERRAFPTPWSLAMFVLELSKPGGECLAVRRDGTLTGYVICSRYEDVWHIMNVAVDTRQRRQGIATALLEELIGRLGEDARLTLEARDHNISGTVRLQFSVNANGEPQNFITLRSLGFGCDEEAVRLVKGWDWIHGKSPMVTLDVRFVR